MKRALLALIVVCIPSLASAQATGIGVPPSSLAPPVIVFPASAVNGSGTVTSTQLLLPDGTSALPSLSFASLNTLGLYKGNNFGFAGVGGGVTSAYFSFGGAGAIQQNSAGLFSWTGSADAVGGTMDLNINRGAAGRLVIANTGSAIGSSIKVDALPTVTSCGAGSPAVVAGSTPFAGSVTIGTTSVATCTITFGGTAFPSAPHCTGSVETSTAANTRAMGYAATTTALVIVPSAAWADSSVVNWHCISSK